MRVESANGTMVLDIGSRDATWNGTEIQLGFAPQFIDDQVFVHGLDLQKNLEPLLFGPPLTFGNRVIVIDPGHGGSNVGTHSVLDGRFEKEFTLDWALRLAPLLETNGWQVFLTRTSDVDVSLSNRVAFAEAHHADLFISLHFNSTPDRDEKPPAWKRIASRPTGMPSTLTRGEPTSGRKFFPTTLLTRRICNLPSACRPRCCTRPAWKIAACAGRGSLACCTVSVARPC